MLPQHCTRARVVHSAQIAFHSRAQFHSLKSSEFARAPASQINVFQSNHQPPKKKTSSRVAPSTNYNVYYCTLLHARSFLFAREVALMKTNIICASSILMIDNNLCFVHVRFLFASPKLHKIIKIRTYNIHVL